MRLGRLLAVGCMLTSISVAGVAYGQGAPAGGPSPLGGGAVPPSAPELAQARRAAEDRLFWLGSPQARQERRTSRTAFRGRLGVARARSLAVSRFGGLVSGPVWSQPELSSDERKVGMRGDRVMLVRRDGKPGGLVDSTVPLVATTQDGTRRPTDVSLVDGAEGFHARNPVVPSVIGKRLGDGITMPQDGLALVPDMPGADSVGKAAQDRVFYADAAKDTDVIAGPTPTGAAIYYQLRSAVSPSELVLRVEMPDRAELRPAPSGDGSAEVVTGSELLATITPPLAVDAQGQSVPARYVMSGDRLSIAVDHQSGDFAYPILVDPVIDNYSTWRSNPSIPIFGWQYASPWPASFPAATNGSWGRGLYISNAVQYFYSTTYGWWVYNAPGQAFIYRADFIGLYHQVAPGAGPSCLTTGIINASDWQRTPGTWQVQRPTGTVVADWRYDSIPRVSCQGMTNETYILWTDQNRGQFGEPSNAAGIQYWMYGNGNRTGAGRAYMAGSVIHMSDSQAPTITGGPPAVATDPNQTWSFSYIDQGLGTYQVLVDDVGEPAAEEGSWDQTKVMTTNCFGTAWSPCPTGSQSLTRKMGNLSNGTHTIRLQVTDAGGKITPVFRTVTVNYPYPRSVRYGGANYNIDTTAETEATYAAINSLPDDDAVTAFMDGLTPEDEAELDQYIDAHDGIDSLGGEDEDETTDDAQYLSTYTCRFLGTFWYIDDEGDSIYRPTPPELIIFPESGYLQTWGEMKCDRPDPTKFVVLKTCIDKRTLSNSGKIGFKPIECDSVQMDGVTAATRRELYIQKPCDSFNGAKRKYRTGVRISLFNVSPAPGQRFATKRRFSEGIKLRCIAS